MFSQALSVTATWSFYTYIPIPESINHESPKRWKFAVFQHSKVVGTELFAFPQIRLQKKQNKTEFKYQRLQGTAADTYVRPHCARRIDGNLPPEVRRGAIWQTDGGGLLFGADTELTHARLFWQTQMVRTCFDVHATYFGTALSPLHSWSRSSPTSLVTIIHCQPAAVIISDSNSLFRFLVFFPPRLFSTIRRLPRCWLCKYVRAQIFPKALADIDGTKIGNSCWSKLMSDFVLKLKITKTDGC